MAKRPRIEVDRPGNGFKTLGDRLAKTTRRSEFSKWLAQADHYDRLADEIAKHGVRWDEVAKWAKDEGITKDLITGLAAKRAYEREGVARRKAAAAVRAPPPKREQPARMPSPDVRMMPEPKVDDDRMGDVIKNMTDAKPWMKPKRKSHDGS